MAPPHTDEIVALTLSRRRLAEYAVPEAIDRSCAFPGSRVWLIEIERAKGDVPAGVAVWRSRGADGEWRTRCACVWTRGRIRTDDPPAGDRCAVGRSGQTGRGRGVRDWTVLRARDARGRRRIARRDARAAPQRDRQGDGGSHRAAGGIGVTRPPRRCGIASGALRRGRRTHAGRAHTVRNFSMEPTLPLRRLRMNSGLPPSWREAY